MPKLKPFLALLLLLLAGQAGANPHFMALSGPTVGSSAIDYTQDANCKAAWYMNGGVSANGDSETDRSASVSTLTEAGGDIPNSLTVPAGYGGKSRDFELADSEVLYLNDGGATDISGANQAISIVFWVRFETAPATTTGDIVSKFLTVGQKQYRAYASITGPSFRMALSNDGTASTVAIGATVPVNNTWYHVAMVYDDTDMRIYVNGALDTNGADNPKAYVAGIFNGSDPLCVGANVNTGLSNQLDGLLDEVAIFDRELSAAEVLDIYTNGLDGAKGGND